jgi:glycosyltransferase involved in cell wall biosynthesis
VRDYGRLLSDALEAEGVGCSIHWLELREQGLRAQRSAVARFGDSLERELAGTRPDAVLVQYSVFPFSFRGVPLWVEPVFRALSRSGAPVLTVLHEFAYPWGYGGIRGAGWAITQRAALVEVVRSSASLIATTEDRVRWLRTRSWLPRRDTALAPVFSNLPAPALAPAGGADGQARDGSAGPAVLGLFGYSHQTAAVELTLAAIASLRARGQDVRLRLLGAPGRSSEGGEQWVAKARAFGLEDELLFSGRLPAQELSDEIAACEMLLFADTAGPSSRKTTLAASLASGRPVLAIDGPARWQRLIDARAARVVEPAAEALTDAVAELLGDRAAREALGARGREFYAREMDVGRTISTVKDLLGGMLTERD